MRIETLRMFGDFIPNDINDLHEILGGSETMKS